MNWGTIHIVVVFVLALISEGCVSSKTRFETSYKELIAAENIIGRQLLPIGAKTDDELVDNFIDVVSEQTRNANIALCDSFRIYERSIGADPAKALEIRDAVLRISERHGAVMPTVCLILPRSEIDSIRLTFPWEPYVTPTEYIQFVDNNNIKKSVAAERAWDAFTRKTVLRRQRMLAVKGCRR